MKPSLKKCNWSDDSLKWHEAEIQAAIVQWLRRSKILFTSDLAGVKLSRGQAMKAKVGGMISGHPDITIWLDTGKVIFIELKNGTGSVSATQKTRHKDLKRLGFEVHVVKVKCPQQGVNAVKDIVKDKT